VGKGSITYIGCAMESQAMKAAVAWMLAESGLKAVMPEAPADVDVAIRSGNGKRVLILTNYGEKPRTVALPQAMTDVLSGAKESSVTLAQYGVALLR